MFEFPPFRHVNWINDLPPPKFDLATSNIIPDWGGLLPKLDPLEMARMGNPNGDQELRQHLASTYGVGLDQVMITNGTSEANFLAYLSTVGKGSRVLIEKPIYTPLVEVPRSMGCAISFIKRRPDDYRIDLRELGSKLEAGVDLLVLQNHNNPSGKALQGPDLRDIARACSEHGVPVLCDEVYRDFALSPTDDGLKNPIPSMVQIYDKGITTGSVTKVYGAGGLVTGWLIAGKRLIQRAKKTKIMIDPMVSNYGNKVALQVLRNRDKVLPVAFAELREKLRLVMTWARGRDDIHWSEPDGCAVGFMRYEYDVPSLEFCERMYKEYHTRAIPGEFFHLEKGFRIGLTKPYNEVKGGLGMIDAFLDDLSKGR